MNLSLSPKRKKLPSFPSHARLSRWELHTTLDSAKKSTKKMAKLDERIVLVTGHVGDASHLALRKVARQSARFGRESS